MQLLVLGATGRIGRLVADEAVARGHKVTALVRSPEALAGVAAPYRADRGDALDSVAVATAVDGQDAARASDTTARCDTYSLLVV